MKHIVTILLVCFSFGIQAQNMKGTLKQHAGQQITLTGFDYYNTKEIASTVLDSLGNFSLNYPKNYRGMAILETQDNSNVKLVLTEPNLELKGTHLNQSDSLQVLNSAENRRFVKYAKTYTESKQAYKAWRYLQLLYTSETSLQKQKKVSKSITKEVQRLEKVNTNSLNLVPENSYLYWFLPLQTLVNNMPATVNNYTERLPKEIQQFRSIDFTHPNFKTSGLFKQLIEGHYMLLENMGQPLDSVFKQMNASTDYLIDNLQSNDSLLSTMSEAMFVYFEKRSLYSAAAHLSHRMLSQNEGSLTTSLANNMQKYNDLKVGNIAPDIQLNATTQLSNIKKSVLLVFGESSCSHCTEQTQELLEYYPIWKAKKDVEVIYISMDTDKDAFKIAYQNTPWQTYCNFKGWETEAVKAYYVNATPTYFLLDKNMKILVHPSSLGQVDAWVNYIL